MVNLTRKKYYILIWHKSLLDFPQLTMNRNIGKASFRVKYCFHKLI